MSIQSEDDTFEAAPFAEWLEAAKRRGVDLRRCGLDYNQVRRLISGAQPRVSIELVDRVLSRAGDSLEELYPYVEALPLYTEAELAAGKRRHCSSCHFEELLLRDAGGWTCAGCGHYSTRLPPPTGWRRTIPDSVVHEYAQGGISITALAKKHGFSCEGVRARIHKAGIPLHPRGGRAGNPRVREYGGWAQLAMRARQLRRLGWVWPAIAEELGYSSTNACVHAVRYYSKKLNKEWPPC